MRRPSPSLAVSALLLALAPITGLNATGQEAGSAVGAPARAIEAYLDAASRHAHFSGTVLIAKDGQPMFGKAYGMASYELAVPNRMDTRYNLGSLAKQFTAMAVMQLQDRGKLRTADSICTYLKRCPDTWKSVTIRHLLTHQSGIPNFSSLPDWDERHSPVHFRGDALADLFRDLPLDFVPGTSVRYSNSGYYLLAKIIERASGMAYADFLEANIFAKLGMRNTGRNDFRDLLPGRAVGHYSRGPHFIAATYEHPSSSLGAGGIWSTSADMLAWLRALDSRQLASAAAYREMFTPSLKHYGYGWLIRERWNLRTIEHSGSQAGYSSYILRIPERGLAIIVLGNSDRMSAGQAATDLAAILLGQAYAMPKAEPGDTLWTAMEKGGVTAVLRTLGALRDRRVIEGKDEDGLLVGLGYDLYEAGKLVAARAIFDENLRQRPTSAYSLDGLADIAIASDEPDRAIALFQRSLAIAPDNDYAKRGLERLSKP